VGLDRLDHLVGDQRGLGERLTAVDHSVADSADLGDVLEPAARGVGQRRDDHLEPHGVVWAERWTTL
jgi:hypothetical protein